MKSLAKIIISLGIKIAIVALFVAIAIGLSSCKGCNAAVDPSFSTDIIQETSNASESLREGVTPVPSNAAETSSLVLQDNKSQKNSDVKTPDETRNDGVAKPTEQTADNNTERASNTREDDSDPVNEDPKPTATPTPKQANNSSSSSGSGSGSGNTSTPTNTPVPTATPKPTATPSPTPTSTPVPTATPTPEPTEAPKPAVAAYVQATFIVYGSTDDENQTYVESTVVRTYKVQPKEGCSYHSHQVSDYVCIDNQISWTDLDNAFLKEHPGCVVNGYDTVGEQVIGFVDD